MTQIDSPGIVCVMGRVVGENDAKEYLDHKGYLNQSLPGVKKGGIKGEVKRGPGLRERTGPERGKRGKNEGKRVRGKGPESTLENL